MVTYSREKLVELILYFSTRFAGDPNFASVQLAKVLFWSDFERFREAGDAITDTSYVRMPYGPAPNGFNDTLMSLENGGLIRIERRGDQKRPVALREPNLELFTAGELAVVGRAIA